MQLVRLPWQIAWVSLFLFLGNIACGPANERSPRAERPEDQQPPSAKDYEILYPDHGNSEEAADEDEEDIAEPTPDEEIAPENEDIEEALKKKDPMNLTMGGKDGVFTMAAIGDSISVGFDALLPAFNRSLSWSTGNHFLKLVKSHYIRAKEIFPGKVVKLNKAKAGANVEAVLDKQMPELMKSLKGRELDYLTLMIGANDLCFWPRAHQEHLARYKENIRSIVKEAMHENEDVKITFVPVPDMLMLYELGKTKACSYAWRLVNMCDVLFFSHEESDRIAFGQRLADMNNSLKAVAEEYPNNIFYAEKVATASFVKEDISDIDCFHPSEKGLQKIARDSWEGGWYDRLGNDMLVGQ